MTLSALDWTIVAAFFALSLVIGVAVARRASLSASEFFLSDRQMPWWLLGVSMVATTFAIDTPNLVTNIVRENGVSGNWVWWAFLLTGMLTVIAYARLWRRTGISTDLEFYELRYSGRPAAFLRGFRAIYLGVFFNVMIMANVCLAAIKLGGVALGLSPVETIVIASIVTVIYSSIGGLRGVLVTDFVQFGIAMWGSIWAAKYVVGMPQIGGLRALLAKEEVVGKLSMLPDFNDKSLLISVFVIPLAVQWWSVWYPGSEPGGGGYVAQRMLSAKNERHALGATLLFNVAHYALRPWPWIIIALASLVVYPNLESLGAAFPDMKDAIVQHDLAYPAMLVFLPEGLLGLVVASLVAAFMSTISTHLNWGASYLVNDFYCRFLDRDASEAKKVKVGRFATVGLMALGSGIALLLKDSYQAFNILLSIGAGTGLIFLLRWFWWRINAFTEITGMIASFVVALFFEFGYPLLGQEPLEAHVKLCLSIGVTTLIWMVATLLTAPDDEETLKSFYRLVRPIGLGWKAIRDKVLAEDSSFESQVPQGSMTRGLLAFLIGTLAVYCSLFGIGYLVYGSVAIGVGLLFVSVVGIAGLLKLIWR